MSKYLEGYKYPEITDENMKIIDISEKHRTCFISEYNSKNNKRWKRYIDKFKNELNDYIDKMFPQTKENNIYDVNDFITSIIKTYYNNLNEEDDELKTLIFKETFCYMIKTYDNQNLNLFEEFYLENIINFIENKNLKNDINLNSIIEIELENCAKDYISKIYAINENIEESSYFLTLPIETIDILDIFSNLLNRVVINIEHIFVYANNYLSSLNDKLNSSLIEEKINLNKIIEDKETIIKEKNNIISNLKNKTINNENNLAEKLKEDKEYNLILKRKNIKLEKKYNELLNMYKNIKQEKLEDKDTSNISLALKEIDLMAKYVFVLIDDTAFENKIKKIFKNSLFISNNINLEEKNIDLVIVITSHIDHTTYYGIKNQCKNKNIPFLHCEYSNIDLIKELIWNNSN